jgi:hypothetical protein
MASHDIPFEERKQHSLYLNDIFKKLSAIDYTTKYDNKTLSLQVPENYQDYYASILLMFGSGRPAVRWMDIKYLQHLDNALSHLMHPEYVEKYQLWLDLKERLSEYNELVPHTTSTLVG